jgi:DNA-directed RNA polymerase specialized sigma24 family protein
MPNENDGFTAQHSESDGPADGVDGFSPREVPTALAARLLAEGFPRLLLSGPLAVRTYTEVAQGAHSEDQLLDQFRAKLLVLLRGMPRELLAALRPEHFPQALLLSNYVLTAYTEVYGGREVRPGASAEQLFARFLSALQSRLVKVQNAIFGAAYQACARPGTGACGGHKTLLDDVISGIFVVVVEGKNLFDPTRGTEEAWFGGIARKLVLKARHKTAVQGGGRPVMDVALIDPAAHGDDARVVDEKDTVEAMLNVLTDPTERQTFAALYLDELTPEEAAVRFRVSKWAIYKRRETIANRLQAAGFAPDVRPRRRG